MGPTHFLYCMGVGAGGAAAVEMLKLWEVRGKLTERRFYRLMRSPMFYLLVAGMLFAAGFVTWAWHGAHADSTPMELVITGAAAGSLLRQGAAAAAANKPVTFGSGDEGSPIRDALL